MNKFRQYLEMAMSPKEFKINYPSKRTQLNKEEQAIADKVEKFIDNKLGEYKKDDNKRFNKAHHILIPFDFIKEDLYKSWTNNFHLIFDKVKQKYEEAGWKIFEFNFDTFHQEIEVTIK